MFEAMYNMEFEKKVLNEISGQEMWKHLEFMSGVHRQSGTEEDFKAVDYIVEKLKSYDVDIVVHEFESLISHPVRASLRCVYPEGSEKEFHCKTRALSASTPPQGIRGEVVFVPTTMAGAGIVNGVADDDYKGLDVRGKIVLTERGGPDGILDAMNHGAIGFIHLWASDEDVVHEMIASPVWGTATTENSIQLPNIPIVAVKRSEGLYLKELCQKGKVEVLLRADTDTKWRKLRIPVATIKGNDEPEKFVLIAGHLDSWYVGITDNATGNACCLELARIFQKFSNELKRSVKIAWWPGHSYGRYSGSTWFNDNFWMDLHNNCISYTNIDSPGCKGATDYSVMTGMSEARELIEKTVYEITGQITKIERPTRCADQSFWGTGLTSLFLLMANVPEDVRYSVGGSAGGWWWHSEYDTLDKADLDILIQDAKIYALSNLRLLQSPILPLSLKEIGEEILNTIEAYRLSSINIFDLSDPSVASKKFVEVAEEFDSKVSYAIKNKKYDEAERLNECMLKVLRELVPILYTANGPYYQDLAIPRPAIPGLYQVSELNGMEMSSNEYRFLVTKLLKERNRLTHAVITAANELVDFLK